MQTGNEVNLCGLQGVSGEDVDHKANEEAYIGRRQIGHGVVVVRQFRSRLDAA